MRTVTIPDTELQVSGICLGTAGIGSSIDRSASFRIMSTYVELGGTFFDTASVYADWLPGPRSVSETTLGDWLAENGKRDQITLSTKGGHPDLQTMHVPRMARKEIVHDLDASLRNLRTDVIDLYWLHRDDTSRPAGEFVEILAEQARVGKIRAYGCSNWRADRIAEAQAYADEQGLPRFCADQMMWSLAVIDRDRMADTTTVNMDDSLYHYHTATGLAAVPYSSQAGGYFQKMAAGTVDRMPANQRTLYDSGENRARFERACELAERLSVSITAVALAYLQSQPFVTTPIVGCRTLEQLEDSMAAGDLLLSAEDVNYLEGCSEHR